MSDQTVVVSFLLANEQVIDSIIKSLEEARKRMYHVDHSPSKPT